MCVRVGQGARGHEHGQSTHMGLLGAGHSEHLRQRVLLGPLPLLLVYNCYMDYRGRSASTSGSSGYCSRMLPDPRYLRTATHL